MLWYAGSSTSSCTSSPTPTVPPCYSLSMASPPDQPRVSLPSSQLLSCIPQHSMSLPAASPSSPLDTCSSVVHGWSSLWYHSSLHSLPSPLPLPLSLSHHLLTLRSPASWYLWQGSCTGWWGLRWRCRGLRHWCWGGSGTSSPLLSSKDPFISNTSSLP